MAAGPALLMAADALDIPRLAIAALFIITLWYIYGNPISKEPKSEKRKGVGKKKRARK